MGIKKIKIKKRRLAIRAPVHKPTKVFKNKKKYTRKEKHKFKEDI